MVSVGSMLPLLVGAQGGWLPVWLVGLGRFGPAVLAAWVALLVLRALLRGRRYRIDDLLAGADQERVRAALRAVEARTSGEIVPVVLERSDSHPQARWLLALGALLLGTALLSDQLPWDAPPLVLLCQVALGALGWVLGALLPDLARLVVSEARATHVAEEQAAQEFRAQRLHATADQTGVLLFVSLFERRVIVLGDAGIHARVGDPHWTATVEAVLQGVARGSLRDGLLAGIERCGAVLAEHFPAAPGDRNELPDRLVVRRR